MKAIVWHGVGGIRLDDVPDPTIQEPTDAIVRITTSAQVAYVGDSGMRRPNLRREAAQTEK